MTHCHRLVCDMQGGWEFVNFTLNYYYCYKAFAQADIMKLCEALSVGSSHVKGKKGRLLRFVSA